MADNDRRAREGLLTTIRARRKWYLGLYFLQMLGWLILVVINEICDVNSTDTMGQRVQDAAVAMSFIGQGTLITTIFLIDGVWDGACKLWAKGGEIMGLLFEKARNRFVVQGEKNALRKLDKRIQDNPNLDVREAIAQALRENDNNQQQ